MVQRQKPCPSFSSARFDPVTMPIVISDRALPSWVSFSRERVACMGLPPLHETRWRAGHEQPNLPTPVRIFSKLGILPIRPAVAMHHTSPI